jgi:soluble lytic murein transglycosylase-like protein
MKKIIISFSLFSLFHFSFANDYSLGNSNPFSTYRYNTPQEQIENNQNNNSKITYFTENITNPLIIKHSKKYQNLFNNAELVQGCWDKASTTYGVDPWLLMAVAKVESGFNKSAINRNSNNTADVGLMQINTTWLKTLSKHGIYTRDLLNPCTSIFVGAWIMAQNIKHFGYNQDGIGAYNSPGNIVIRRKYAQKVYQSYNELVKDFNPVIRK